MNTGISFGQQSARWLVARLLMKSCLLAVGVAFLQISFVGGQVQAQPIFRTPQAASPVVAPKLQLTAPSNLKMAPIRNVGLGEVSSSPFQLPQTEQPRGFFQPTPAVQSDSARGQELREVGADGSFLPTDRNSEFEPNQAEAIIDLPGLDLSAL